MSWRELAAQLPDAMSHTTSGKVLTDRQQGRGRWKSGGGEERKREATSGPRALLRSQGDSSNHSASSSLHRWPKATWKYHQATCNIQQSLQGQVRVCAKNALKTKVTSL